MDKPTRILIVEDVAADAELAQREINKDLKPCDYRVVETKEEFLDALETFRPDLIVSDYSLPTFDGMTALKLTLDKTPATPLIILTGSQNEDIAVGCIKAGAADYVLKDSIRRLGPAIASALEVKRVRLEKERAEASLRENEERYRIITENMSDTVWIMDMDFRTTFISPSVVTTRGYTFEELREMPLEKQVTPRSLKIALDVIAEEMTPERLNDESLTISRTLDLEFYRKDGSTLWSEITMTVVRDADVRPDGLLCVGRDITERREAERTIRESERKYRELVENIEDIVYIVDGHGNMIFLNGAAERFFGYSRQETYGRNFAEFLVPASLETAAGIFKKQLAGQDVGVFELDFYDRDKNIRTLETREKMIWEGNRVVEVQGIGRDATEKKKAEEALRESEERYRDLVENIEDIIYVTDEQGRLAFLNGAGEQFIGYPRDEILGRRFADFLTAESIENAAGIFKRQRDGEDVGVFELDFYAADNVIKTVETREKLNWNGDRIVQFQGIGRDVTQRKRALKALHESEERYRELLELAPVGIAVQSEGRIVFTNPAGAAIIGAGSPEEVTGREIAEIIHPDHIKKTRERISRMMAGEQGVYPAENVYVKLDGTPIPVDVIAASITYRGKPAIQVIVTDISKRREAERAISESEERYRELVESIDDLIYITDGTGKLVYLNKALERVSGYTRDELLQKNYMDLLTPDSLKKAVGLFKKQKKGEDIGLFELSIIDKDGKIKILEAREQIVWEGDRIVKTRGFGRDITERKNAEERINHLNRVLESIRNIDQLIVRVKDRQTLLAGACEILCEVSGYYFVWIGLVGEEDKRVRPAAHWGFEDGYLKDITVTWDDSPTGRGPMGTAIRTGKTCVFNDIANSPDFRPWQDDAIKRGYRSTMAIPIMVNKRVYGALGVYSDLVNSFNDEEAASLVEMAEDIAFALSAIETEAERRRSEEALAESEERYRSLIDNIPIGIYRNTPGKKGNFIFCNRALLDMLGVSSQEQLIRLSPTDFYQKAAERKAFSDRLLKADRVSGQELRLKKLDGTPLWGSVTARVVYDAKDRPAYFDCTLEDITERKDAEETVRESEEKFRNFFETSRDIVFITSRDEAILDINSAFEEILGYTRKETLLKNVTFLYKNPQDWDRFRGAVDGLGSVRDFEATLRRKDGAYLDCLFTATVRKDQDGTIIGYQGTIRDVSEKKKMERQLIRAEKLSSLGGILSGVAHEMNNPLTSIIGIAQMIMRGPIPENLKDKLEVIHRESLRTSKIIQGLLTFAREHKPERQMISVNKVIEESYRLREYEFRVDNVAMKLELSQEVPLTAADPYQLQQVFINLINNGHDVLANGGGSLLIIRSFHRDGAIVIEFEDDGPGISEQDIGLIFDPFFTTKEVGKGTGLGLSIVYGIINEHGGRIEVVSPPGKGAMFTIHLPVIKKITDVTPPIKERAEKPKGEKTVLIVEDEEALRTMIGEVLEQDGYRVHLCEDGQQAIEIMKIKRFDGIITDLKMPGIGGKDLYTFVQKYYPEIAGRVLFITGDVLSKDTQGFLKITGNIYLEKPFEIEVLLSRLTEVLER
ncbi:MAG: PAS domain S-box protein [Deltaproteobacteria bacterium]|nr:PAS domain S-box protein [Candidatus Zymogenaceae bacterium]